MMEKAMLHMSNENGTTVDANSIRLDKAGMTQRMEPNGSCYHIQISSKNHQRFVSCTRLNRHMKPHQVPLPMPQPILDYFQKDRSDLQPGTLIEYRTELVVERLRYRAHPNYQDSGPWYYDWVNVTYETDWQKSTQLVQDTNFPIKILGFFRVVEELPQSFKVLVHLVSYRLRGSAVERAETRLLCTWLLETTANERPSFVAIDPDQIQDQIFVVEENPGFHDKYITALDRNVWGVKDMRTSWSLQFREYAVTEHTKTLQEDD
jgi:hypothetical protein